MRFLDLVATSAAVAGVSARREKTARLASLLARLDAEDVETAIAFLSGGTRQGRLGVGYASIGSASGVAPAEQPTLELRDVDLAFTSLADVEGQGSGAERSRLLRELFARATHDEQDFLRRLLYGELRQGALEGVLIDAIARAANVGSAALRRAAMTAGNLGAVARAALVGGEKALTGFVVELMRPVKPMLAASADSVEQALGQLGDSVLEFKVDGARVQVHKDNGEVRVFSRTLRDVTIAVPELVTLVRTFPARSLILDGEIIALRADGAPYPFQVTMSRFGRTLDIDQRSVERPLTPFFFDCIYADGAALLDEPHERRLQMLRDMAGSSTVPSIVRPDREQALTFVREALTRGHEGVMAKALGAPYAAGRRGASWLKIKQVRTLDLVVLAAEWGHGRRRGWLSNLHLGARDPDRHGFAMLGKTFKGMTDEMLAWQTEKLLALEIGRDDYTVHVRPELVVEIAFNEIQESPVYPGGLALRFARVKRYRTDKTAVDADTLDTVRSLWSRSLEPDGQGGGGGNGVHNGETE